MVFFLFTMIKEMIYVMKNEIECSNVKAYIKDFVNNPKQCGFDAFVVTKNAPKLKKINFSEERKQNIKQIRTVLKEMIFDVIIDSFVSEEALYADGHLLADNQNKYLIFEQSDIYKPFDYVENEQEADDFKEDELNEAIGLMFKIRKAENVLWAYQHLWSIMVPNKKKTNIMTRLCSFENRTVFMQQTESILTIAKKVDIIIINNKLVTKNVLLLQKNFGFQDYIYQAAESSVNCIIKTNIVNSSEKLLEYIRRSKTKYAKKMMRIGDSRVLRLSQEQLIEKVNTLPRWQGKFTISNDNQIELNTYVDVENLIDLFDERFTRSDVTDTEYDTDVKTVVE